MLLVEKQKDNTYFHSRNQDILSHFKNFKRCKNKWHADFMNQDYALGIECYQIPSMQLTYHLSNEILAALFS